MRAKVFAALFWLVATAVGVALRAVQRVEQDAFLRSVTAGSPAQGARP